MVSKTNEAVLEATIEKALVGLTPEECQQGVTEPVAGSDHHGYYRGLPADFDPKYALIRPTFGSFWRRPSQRN